MLASTGQSNVSTNPAPTSTCASQPREGLIDETRGLKTINLEETTTALQRRLDMMEWSREKMSASKGGLSNQDLNVKIRASPVRTRVKAFCTDNAGMIKAVLYTIVLQ